MKDKPQQTPKDQPTKSYVTSLFLLFFILFSLAFFFNIFGAERFQVRAISETEMEVTFSNPPPPGGYLLKWKGEMPDVVITMSGQIPGVAEKEARVVVQKYTINNLLPGRTYEITVSGSGVAEEKKMASTPFYPPSNFLAWGEGDVIKFNWVDASWAEDGFYIVEKPNKIVASARKNETQLSFPLSNLYDERRRSAYCIKAYSYGGAQREIYSDCSREVWLGGEILGPYDLKAEVLLPDQIKLTWRDRSKVEEGFKIERTEGTIWSPKNDQWVEVANVGANATSYLDTRPPRPENMVYWYRVKAYNGNNISKPSDQVRERIPGTGQSQTRTTSVDTSTKIHSSASSFGLKILSPRAGDVWTTGQTYDIRWQFGPLSQALTPLAGYMISLTKQSTGETQNLTSSPVSGSNYLWSIPEELGGNYCQIKVTAISASGQEITSVESRFFLIESARNVKITIMQPKENQVLIAGQNFTLKWTKNGQMANTVKITLGEGEISSGTQNDGEFTFKVPTLLGRRELKIETIDGAVRASVSIKIEIQGKIRK